MPKKPLDTLTESMFYVLMALYHAPMCGIDIAAFIEERTGGRLQMGPATLYTILGKFEKVKYIREIEVQVRRRTYEVTPLGREAWEEEVQRLRCCVANAEQTIKEGLL